MNFSENSPFPLFKVSFTEILYDLRELLLFCISCKIFENLMYISMETII